METTTDLDDVGFRPVHNPRRQGFLVPVYLSHDVWEKCVNVTPGAALRGETYQQREAALCLVLRLVVAHQPGASQVTVCHACVTDRLETVMLIVSVTRTPSGAVLVVRGAGEEN